MAIAGRVAIVPKGDWSANVTYKRLDAVTYNNTLYFAKKEVPAGTATSNTEYWSKSIVGGASAIATKEDAGIVKPADGLTVAEDGTLKVSIDGTTLTMDQVNNVIKLADTLKDKINGAFPAANLINNLTTTEAGFGLDARQGKALDDKITEINGSLFKGEPIVLASLVNNNLWTPFTVPNLSQFKQLQILLRDSNISEIASNLTSYRKFKDCNSVIRVFQARFGIQSNNDIAQAHYVDDTHVEIYLGTGSNSKQAVLVGWR